MGGSLDSGSFHLRAEIGMIGHVLLADRRIQNNRRAESEMIQPFYFLLDLPMNCLACPDE